MDNYIVSARKYRPKRFESVVGQSHITDTLEHAISENKLAQAMLFCGPRGVGKTTCARILARLINEKDGSTSEDGFSFNIYELDAASNNSVEDIRNLIDQVRYAPQTGTYKVYIIDEVHMLSPAAFNAFLKTLEEPPAHAIFILATTEKHKIIPTILSRCQIFDFKRIEIEDIKNHLAKISENEGVTYEEDALYLIAKKADGALRDALSIFDRLVTFTQGNLTAAGCAEVLNILDTDTYLQFAEEIRNRNLTGVMMKLDALIKKGFDPHIFIAGLGGHFRDLMFAQVPQTLELLELGPDTREKMHKVSALYSPAELADAIEICNTADVQYKASKNPRLTVEIALMQLLSLGSTQDKKKKFLIDAPSLFKTASVENTTSHKPPAAQSQKENLAQQLKSESRNVTAIVANGNSQGSSTEPGDNQKKSAKKVRKYSIADYLSEEKKEEEEDAELSQQDLPKKDFECEVVQQVFQNYLEFLKKENPLPYYSLYDVKFEKEGDTVFVICPSQVSKDEFISVSLPFFGKVKDTTGHHAIDWQYKIVIPKKRELLTDRKRFEQLAEVYPVLQYLDSVAKLDFK